MVGVGGGVLWGWVWVGEVVVIGVGGVVGVPLVLYLVPLMRTCIFCQFGEKLDSG